MNTVIGESTPRNREERNKDLIPPLSTEPSQKEAPPIKDKLGLAPETSTYKPVELTATEEEIEVIVLTPNTLIVDFGKQDEQQPSIAEVAAGNALVRDFDGKAEEPPTEKAEADTGNDLLVGVGYKAEPQSESTSAVPKDKMVEPGAVQFAAIFDVNKKPTLVEETATPVASQPAPLEPENSNDSGSLAKIGNKGDVVGTQPVEEVDPQEPNHAMEEEHDKSARSTTSMKSLFGFSSMPAGATTKQDPKTSSVAPVETNKTESKDDENLKDAKGPCPSPAKVLDPTKSSPREDKVSPEVGPSPDDSIKTKPGSGTELVPKLDEQQKPVEEHNHAVEEELEKSARSATSMKSLSGSLYTPAEANHKTRPQDVSCGTGRNKQDGKQERRKPKRSEGPFPGHEKLHNPGHEKLHNPTKSSPSEHKVSHEVGPLPDGSIENKPAPATELAPKLDEQQKPVVEAAKSKETTIPKEAEKKNRI